MLKKIKKKFSSTLNAYKCLSTWKNRISHIWCQMKMFLYENCRSRRGIQLSCFEFFKFEVIKMFKKIKQSFSSILITYKCLSS
jgi:hypothetical protein